MNGLEKYKSSTSNIIGSNLLRNFLQGGDNKEGYLELIISLEHTKINIKELSSYLELIYRVDGFLSDLTFVEYSHLPQVQIEIDEIRFGSWEIVIKELVSSVDAEKLVLVGLSLKYIPNIMNSLMDVGLKYIEYKNKNEDFLEKKERRIFRKSIRDAITNDEELNSVDKKTKEKVINLLEKIYMKNSNHLPASRRFVSKSVKGIKLRKKNK